MLTMRVLLSTVLLAACGESPGTNDASTTADAPTPDAPAVETRPVHLIGRFDAEQRFAWPGTKIATRISGTALSVELSDTGDNNYFDVTIDGATTILHAMSGRHVYPLADGLASGEHDVTIARRTESFFGITTFHDFGDAQLVPTPVPTRLIEFIGDSITCGYGVLGVGPSCPFAAATEAETHAWGTYASDALGAAHVAIAYSGIGMARNNDGSAANTMPVRYLRTFADDPGTAWGFGYSPDVIVINLGTNDFAAGDPGTAYRDAYVSFVQQLRTQFPTSWILLATSPMIAGTNRTLARAHLDAIAETVADGRVKVVEIAAQLGSDGFGCDYHPNEVTERKMAAALVDAIRPLTGW